LTARREEFTMSGVTQSKVGSEADQILVPLAALAPDPRNPRRIEPDAATGLAASMEEFGDLSGIVFNDRTKQLVAGHQRVDDLRKAGVTEFHRQGDRGYIEHPKTGERFPIRFVDWPEQKQRLANLTANNPHISGDFTEDALAQLKELEDVEGFAELELDVLEKELESGTSAKEHEGVSLEDFDIRPMSKRTWILIATSADRAPEIENALAQFADDETRIEVSGGK
jgi:hypothetical protein